MSRSLKYRCAEKIFNLIFVFFLVPGICLAETKTSLWGVKKSVHFIVYYQDSAGEYVNELIDKAEQYYGSITEELGFTRFDDFWTWDKRCKIYIYATAKEYQFGTGRPSWSVGSVDIVARTINTFNYEKSFLETILPHEMTHLIFREFVGYVFLPLWLDEGMACFEEKANIEERLVVAEGLVRSGMYMSIAKLNQINQRNLVMPNIFYSESASIIHFLFQKYGNDKFVDFCRMMRDTKGDWQLCLKEVYKFRNLDDMDKEWTAFLTR